MKKLIKSSILVAIFMALLTVVSFAADKEATVSYGELKTDGSMQIMVDFPADIDMSSTSYDNFFSNITSDGWTVSSDRKSMQLTATGVDTKPFIKYYSGGTDDESVVVKVATPYTMKVGNSITFNSSTITDSSNTTIISFSGNEATALKEGGATLTLSSTTAGGTEYTFKIVITVEGSESGDSSETTANFSNATYSYNDSHQLVVENVDKVSNNLFYIVDNNSSTGYSDSAKRLTYNNNYCIDLNTAAGEAIMQNKDAYIHVFEEVYNSGTYSYIKVTDQKLPKPDLSALNKFNDTTMTTHLGTIISFSSMPVWLHGAADGLSARTIHFKIGQITDSNILNAIKNNDANGFSNLLSYAKNATNPTLEKTEVANYPNGYNVNFALTSGSSFIDGAFYYLYAEIDDENGKYIPIESVTIAKASTYPTLEGYPWYLFFYGDDKFNFDGITDDSSNSNTEKENLPSRLAQTGESTIFVVAGIILIATFVIIYKKNKKYSKM